VIATNIAVVDVLRSSDWLKFEIDIVYDLDSRVDEILGFLLIPNMLG